MSGAAGWVRRGADALTDTTGQLESLCSRVGAPVTARPLWLQAWADSYREYEPLLVGVDGVDGPVAVAALAVRRGRLVDDIVLCGHGPTDTTTWPVHTADAAVHLAQAVADVVTGHDRPWRVLLRHLAEDDTVAPHLVDLLPRAARSRGEISPQLVASAGRELRDYVSSSHRKGINRIRNRMVSGGLRPDVAQLRTREQIEELLPRIEEIHRSRDEELGRRSDLDDPRYARFFRRVVTSHADAGRLVLTTLTLEGRLAAYVLCFVDGDVHRMWNCRFDPAWGRYSPGKLAMEESVGHALAAGCSAYDFMRGAEPYKFSYANHLPETWDLHAASNAVVGLPLTAAAAARPRLRKLRDGDGLGARAVHAVDTARARRVRR